MKKSKLKKKIPFKHELVLRKLAEVSNFSLDYMKERYHACESDKNEYVEDMKCVIDGLNDGTYVINPKTLELEVPDDAD